MEQLSSSDESDVSFSSSSLTECQSEDDGNSIDSSINDALDLVANTYKEMQRESAIEKQYLTRPTSAMSELSHEEEEEDEEDANTGYEDTEHIDHIGYFDVHHDDKISKPIIEDKTISTCIGGAKNLGRTNIMLDRIPDVRKIDRISITQLEKLARSDLQIPRYIPAPPPLIDNEIHHKLTLDGGGKTENKVYTVNNTTVDDEGISKSSWTTRSRKSKERIIRKRVKKRKALKQEAQIEAHQCKKLQKFNMSKTKSLYECSKKSTVKDVDKLTLITERLNHRHKKGQTVIATYNVNGFLDHQIIADLMEQLQIDIMVIQEPFAHNKTRKDDMSWTEFMKKELREKKYEIIVSKNVCIVFDEQTMGPHLSVVLRTKQYLQGRILSITFATTDQMWECFTVIAIYGVSSPTSNKKYAKNATSRRTTHRQVSKALQEELDFIENRHNGTPIIVIGDFNETLWQDDRDNINTLGQKITKDGALQHLNHREYKSAFHTIHPNKQMVTRWDRSRGSGRHIDLCMMNPLAASLIQEVQVDDSRVREKVTSDHSIVIARFRYEKQKQDVIDQYRQKINFGRIAKIGMTLKCQKTPDENGLGNKISYDIKFNNEQFRSRKVAEDEKLLQRFQDEANKEDVRQRLTRLETDITQLQGKLNEESSQCQINAFGVMDLVNRTEGDRNKLNDLYNEYMDLVHTITARCKLVSYDCPHEDALIARIDSVRNPTTNYGASTFNLYEPVSKIRSAMGDVRIAITTLNEIKDYLCGVRDPKKKKIRIKHRNRIYKRRCEMDNDSTNNDSVTSKGNTITKDLNINVNIDRHNTISKLFKTFKNKLSAHQRLRSGVEMMRENQEEWLKNENAIAQHREIDKFDGEWHAAKFTFMTEIATEAFAEANNILQRADVSRTIDYNHLDSRRHGSSDNWVDTHDWWNGPAIEDIIKKTDEELMQMNLLKPVEDALKNLKKTNRSSIAFLFRHNKSAVGHHARLNRTQFLSKKLNRKSNEQAEGHPYIVTETTVLTESVSRCTNSSEMIDNAKTVHQHWTSPSKSEWQHFWFQTKHDQAGPCGVVLKKKGIPTDEEVRKLIHESHKVPTDILQEFRNAHGNTIQKLLMDPAPENPTLAWPWYPTMEDQCIVTNKSTNPNEVQNCTGSTQIQDRDSAMLEMENQYWKGITSIPGKARFQGYTMAVIGRLPVRWIESHMKLMKMILYLRLIPVEMKQQSRIPIPKPNAPAETRPISLLHDDLCFLLGLITKHFSKACEAAGVFPDSLKAYRKGKSTSNITIVDLAAKEDALEFGRTLILTSEDEEKFFDRVSLEVQLAVLKLMGFPNKGLIEFKAEEMFMVTVHLLTRQGTTQLQFQHGLKQGSPLSCLMSNLVMTFKHKTWMLACMPHVCGREEEIDLATNDMWASEPGYSVSIWDKRDGCCAPIIDMEGYCDDNQKYNDGINVEDMVRNTLINIRMAGFLSMLFKIGRKGKKTIIEITNLQLKDLHKIPTEGFSSIAWSFIDDAPIREQIDCRIFLCKEDVGLSTKPDNVSETVWQMVLNGQKLTPERNLGIYRDGMGNTKDSTKRRIAAHIARADKVFDKPLTCDKATILAYNVLVLPVIHYGYIENAHSFVKYNEVDEITVRHLGKQLRLLRGDAKQMIYVSEGRFGLGLRSIVGEMLIGIAREAEVQLNDEARQGMMLRSRLMAEKTRQNNAINTDYSMHYILLSRNLVRRQNANNIGGNIINALAKFGIYLRNGDDLPGTFFIEAAMNIKSKQCATSIPGRKPLGVVHFAGKKSKTGTTLGLGDDHLLWARVYGKAYTLLSQQCDLVNLTFDEVAAEAVSMLQTDLSLLYNFYEWRMDSNNSYSSNIAEHTRLSMDGASYHNIMDTCDDIDMLSFLSIPREYVKEQIHKRFLAPHRITNLEIETLCSTGWPLIISTDGGGKDGNGTCAAVLFYPPTISFTEFMQLPRGGKKFVFSQKLKIWRARGMILPRYIGHTPIDNTHAECMALNILLEWIPAWIPRIIIMDSESERSRFQVLQNNTDVSTREMMKSLLAGVSKILATRLRENLHGLHGLLSYDFTDNDKDGFNLSYHMRQLRDMVVQNLRFLCLEALSWCTKEDGSSSSWLRNQWAIHELCPIWSVRSHQIMAGGTISHKNRFGNVEVPNHMCTTANQAADNICTLLLQHTASHQLQHSSSEIVKLGIDGPSYFYTHNGRIIDRRINSYIRLIIDNEFVNRARMKATHGLLLRFAYLTTMRPEMLGRSGFGRKIFEGRTAHHTRQLYIDAKIYRKGSVIKRAREEEWIMDTLRLKRDIKKGKEYTYYKACPWCRKAGMNAVQLDAIKGDARHSRFYCQGRKVARVREESNSKLEECLQQWMTQAQLLEPRGDEILRQKVVTALAQLEQTSFYNASKQIDGFTRTARSDKAILTMQQWEDVMVDISSKKAASTNLIHTSTYDAQEIFNKWPLMHQLGYLPGNVYTNPRLQDGEYHVVDLITFGAVPIVMEETVLQFHKELKEKIGNEQAKQFITEWTRVKCYAVLRSHAIMVAAASQIHDYRQQLKIIVEDYTKQCEQLNDEDSIMMDNEMERDAEQELDTLSLNTSQQCHIDAVLSIDPTTNVEQQSTRIHEQHPLCNGFTCTDYTRQKTNLRSNRVQLLDQVCCRCNSFVNAVRIAAYVEEFLLSTPDMMANFLALRLEDSKVKIDTVANFLRSLPLCHNPSWNRISWERSTRGRKTFSPMATKVIRMICSTTNWQIMGPKGIVEDIFYLNLLGCTAMESACRVCECECYTTHPMEHNSAKSQFCSLCNGRRQQEDVSKDTTAMESYKCAFCEALITIEVCATYRPRACRQCYFIGIMKTNGIKQRYETNCRLAQQESLMLLRSSPEVTRSQHQRRRRRQARKGGRLRKRKRRQSMVQDDTASCGKLSRYTSESQLDTNTVSKGSTDSETVRISQSKARKILGAILQQMGNNNNGNTCFDGEASRELQHVTTKHRGAQKQRNKLGDITHQTVNTDITCLSDQSIADRRGVVHSSKAGCDQYNHQQHRTIFIPDSIMIHECATVGKYINEDVINCYFAALMATYPHIHVEGSGTHQQITSCGSWTHYAKERNNRRIRGNHDKLCSAIQDRNKIVILPVGFGRDHWTVLVRRFDGAKWIMWFADSLTNGHERRFEAVKSLYNALPFTDGMAIVQWQIAPMVNQVEYECGARACVSGTIIAMADKNVAQRLSRLTTVRTLNILARKLVADICSSGGAEFSIPKWLSKVIGHSISS